MDHVLSCAWYDGYHRRSWGRGAWRESDGVRVMMMLLMMRMVMVMPQDGVLRLSRMLHQLSVSHHASRRRHRHVRSARGKRGRSAAGTTRVTASGCGGGDVELRDGLGLRLRSRRHHLSLHGNRWLWSCCREWRRRRRGERRGHHMLRDANRSGCTLWDRDRHDWEDDGLRWRRSR